MGHVDRAPDGLDIMGIRTRKLIGAFALVALVFAWVLAAMVLAQAILPSAHSVLAMVYYVVAGMGWVLPAMPLMRWMLRPDPEG